MRWALTFALTLASIATAHAEPKADYGALSWGKPGVTYLQYRLDAVECTSEGVFAVLGEQPSQSSSQPVISADPTRPPDISTSVSAAVLDSMQSSMQARNERQEIVDRCLLARGYTPFLLTDDQRAQLRSYDRGTPERREYLFTLASDENVVHAQATEVRAARQN